MIYLWLDVLFFWMLIRTVKSAQKLELLVEFFKFIGAIIAVVIGLHYYPSLGKILSHNFFAPPAVDEMFAFGLITGAVIFGFSLVREGWISILDITLKPDVNRIGGNIFAYLKLFFLYAFVTLMLSASGNEFVAKSGQNSYIGFLPKHAAVGLYKGIYKAVISKFSSDPLNEKVAKLVEMKKEEAAEEIPLSEQMEGLSAMEKAPVGVPEEVEVPEDAPANPIKGSW